jgi:hypothetical protein
MYEMSVVVYIMPLQFGVKCKLVTRVTREHVIGGRDFASQNFARG